MPSNYFSSNLDLSVSSVDNINSLDLWNSYNDELTQETLSVPDVKLFYPEPFIASPSLVHSDIWFIHILHYQYWLWFMFISLIMFYLITFINIVRWCTLRTFPKRETRGVSRSKCADLITACLPISWAISIIISETVDATDYYDGFGTGEIVIGIRAYQWGWEYFYPKNIDLNYNLRQSYSSFIGNSLKYNNTSSETLESNSLWKFYQNMSTNSLSVVPASVVLSPNDSINNLNLLDFSNVGRNISADSTAFKKIQNFSKLNPQFIYTESGSYYSRFNKVNSLYVNESALDNINPAASIYRQHNYTSLKTSLNMFTTLVDTTSFKKFFAYTIDSNSTPGASPRLNPSLPNEYTSANLFSPKFQNLTTLMTLYNQKFINKFSFNQLSLFNENTSLKDHFISPSNSLLAYLPSTQPLSAFVNNDNLSFKNHDFTPNTHSLESLSPEIASNQGTSFKTLNLKSGGQSVTTQEKSLRELVKSNPVSPYQNTAFATKKTLFQASDNLPFQSQNLFSIATLGWTNFINQKNLLSSQDASPLTAMSNFTPQGTLPFTKTFNKPSSFLSNQRLLLLNSKEESAPSYLFNNYWLSYLANSTPNTYKYTSLMANFNKNFNLYLPYVSLYSGYDFPNLQGLDVVEDSLWESIFPSFLNDEYLANTNLNTKETFFSKQNDLFNLGNRHKKFKLNVFTPGLSKLNITKKNSVYSLPLFSEESFLTNSLLSTKNYDIFNNESSLDTIEDVSTNLKYYSYLYFFNYKNLYSTSSNFNLPASYSQILDSFTSNYEEVFWDLDENLSNLSTVDNALLTNTSDTPRATNPLKLRSTAKNSIVTYNAIQKVFKSRFDEGRSNARLLDFSNSYNSYLFLTEPKANYENMLAKNTESFFNVSTFVKSFNTNFNEITQVLAALNSTYLDVPFLLSNTSDSARYLWFDWQAKWTSLEVQPSSAARYSLLGTPYLNKSYEYVTSLGNELLDSENYAVKLGYARKNYMTTWAYSPYFFAKSLVWFNYNSLYFNTNLTLNNTKFFFKEMLFLWTNNVPTDTSKYNSTLGYSNYNSFTRSFIRSHYDTGAYNYSVSLLMDILAKREYIFKKYYISKDIISNLPKAFTCTFDNPLLEEIKFSFLYIDPTIFNKENHRNFFNTFYTNTNVFNLALGTNFLSNLNSYLPLNTLNINKLLLTYVIGDYKALPTNLGKNYDLYRSQYRPMRKGVTNMIRLQATGIIAMPTEIRLHILASSKDVIHSWAIPSAGVKIDCVPGYSSHRVAIFLASGIFWGQCMEICGRFHHWMPIVVYFMKRDLFFLWCTHFMHYSADQNLFTTADNQNINFLRNTNFNSVGWVSELL
jgi:heme/copper-type cytochrome/quinol oxidase subunit 2